MKNGVAVVDKNYSPLLKEIKEKIAELKPWKVIVFGSAAKGTLTRTSPSFTLMGQGGAFRPQR